MMTCLDPRGMLRRFARDEDGNIAIEMMLILPILFWAYLSMFAIFDAYRQHAINQKAAFTLGDIVSRQTTPIDIGFLNGTQQVLNYLTNSRSETSIRVTSLKYDANNNVYKRDWSKVKGTAASPLGNNDVQNWHDRLPVMLHNERIVVVETFVDYNPPFNTGLQERTISNFVFTRPRYAPQVLWNNEG